MLDTLSLTAPRRDLLSPAWAPSLGPAAGYAIGDSGRFVLRRRERLLLAGEEPAALGSRAFELLLALVETDGH